MESKDPGRSEATTLALPKVKSNRRCKHMYAFTCKINNISEPTKDDYNKVIDFLVGNGVRIKRLMYEHQHKLHLHALVSSHKNLMYKNFAMEGVHIYFRRLDLVRDLQRWCAYLRKQFTRAREDQDIFIRRSQTEDLFDI